MKNPNSFERPQTNNDDKPDDFATGLAIGFDSLYEAREIVLSRNPEIGKGRAFFDYPNSFNREYLESLDYGYFEGYLSLAVSHPAISPGFGTWREWKKWRKGLPFSVRKKYFLRKHALYDDYMIITHLYVFPYLFAEYMAQPKDAKTREILIGFLDFAKFDPVSEPDAFNTNDFFRSNFDGIIEGKIRMDPILLD